MAAAAAAAAAVLAAEAWQRPLVAHPLTDRGTVASEGQTPAALVCDTNGPSEPPVTSGIGYRTTHVTKAGGISTTTTTKSKKK